MSNLQFTPAQQDAIDAMGGSVIVSAAAGSGKTRVLVQRVIKLLTDPVHPIDADRLLIVTFTKAAAEEMRSRIAAAIDEKLFYEPDNISLRRQQLLLSNADICTIHSFCSRMIRENFYLLDINQDFRIASEGESDVLKAQVLSTILEEEYQKSDDGFCLLTELLSTSRSDKSLEKNILSVYQSCSAHPFPADWLDTAAAFYHPDIDVSQSIYAKVAFDRLNAAFPYMDHLITEAAEIIQNNQAFCSGTKTCGENKLQYLREFRNRLHTVVQTSDWDSIVEFIGMFQKVSYRKPTGKKISVTEEECISVKNCFDSFDELILDKLFPIFSIDSETYHNDTTLLYPAVLSLCAILKEFDRRFYEEKKERGLLDFSDLEHLMLRLLVEHTEDGLQRTDFAVSLSKQYDQIMVDEYQDTNETQECIFRYVSDHENNLFVVGDIKQSIYRFREAMPEIFKNRRKASKQYDRENPAFPAKIILDKNFRSRSGIINSVNYIFHAIMSERVGEIEYNAEEKLTAGADYPEWNEVPFELHLMDIAEQEDMHDEEESSNEDHYISEARYIAAMIQKKIRSGMKVTDKGKLRPATYSDFAVMMRFLSAHGQSYADVLNQCGVPAYIDKPYSLFGCTEVNTLISLLKIIDNPLQDIPMLSVLLSPAAGFTADDLTDLKTEVKGRFIYHRLSRLHSETEEDLNRLQIKCNRFMQLFSELRTLSVTVSVSKLLDSFLSKTGYSAIVGATENGDIRVRNIRKFLSFVRDYENRGKRGLTDFVRYITYLEENGTEITAADSAPSDAVKIMSIHHSKGLEFPVCILAGLNSKGSSDKEEILCHADLGFGLKTIDRKKLLKYNTLQRNIIRRCKASENQSEAMRVLYVALTRAKEKLIAVVSYSVSSKEALNKKLSKLASGISIDQGRISPYTIENTNSLADWLMISALVHPSMHQLRADADHESLETLPCETSWQYHRITEISFDEPEDSSTQKEVMADPALSALLQQRFSEKYAFSARTAIPSKVSASALVHNEQLDYHIADSRPSFMQKEKMTGAEKGTAMHLFLQHADLTGLEQSPESEKKRMTELGIISAEQSEVIHTDDLNKFLNSRIYALMKNADKVLREYRFTVNISAAEIDKSYPPEENVILQGAIDCLILEPDGITIVDYKTDKSANLKELAEKYQKQLLLYREAASQLFDIPVKACYIYSITHASEIEIHT